jgi:peptidoglycan/LPS O-acetylase OafA/YrhL
VPNSELPARTAEGGPPAHIPALDGLRGCAILLVILFHCQLLSFGWAGVHLFFVLSGFLITRILLAERGEPFGPYLRRFYFRRAVRIFPLYLLYLAVIMAIYSYAGRTLHLFPWLFSYLYNWLKAVGMKYDDPGLGHLWSLAIEEQFYFVWPLVVYFSGRRLLPICIAVVCATPLVRAVSGMIFVSEPGVFEYHATICQADALVIGAAVAVLEVSGRLTFRMSWLLGALAIAIAAGIACAGANHGGRGILEDTWYPLLLPQNGQYIWAYTLFDLIFALLVVATVQGAPLLAGILRNRVLRWVGTISYGCYVYHMAVGFVVRRLLHISWEGPTIPQRLTLLAAMLIATGTVATVSYYGFEKRLLALKNRIPASRRGFGDSEAHHSTT